MAVGHSETWESAVSASTATFDLFTSVTIAASQAAIVFVVSILGTDNGSSVTWAGVTMNAVPYTAHDTDTEPGSVKAYFLDGILTGASRTCTITRTNNATQMIAFGATVTALGACEVYNAGIVTRGGSAVNTGASTSSTGISSTHTTDSVTDGSPGTSSLRYACRYGGAASPGSADAASSTLLNDHDFTSFGVTFVRETTAGQGARNIGFSALSDDCACIALAIREVAVAAPPPYTSRTYRQIAAY